MKEKNNTFASYDLEKNRKINENKDSEFRATSFYKQGKEFYSSFKYVYENGKLDCMTVILTNTAFSCELFLKALLYHFNISFKLVHGLKALYDKLEDPEKDFISKNIFCKSPYKDNFEMCLSEQDEAFTLYRYSCELDRYVGNFNFLFSFANILEYVCSINIKM